MKEFSTEQIQSAFEKLPSKLQGIISSPEIHEKIMAIGGRYDLHIDQIGELVDQIGLVMLGLEKSSNFVSDASSRLSISTKDAQAIANEINTEIFSIIKTNMRETGEAVQKARSDISSLERAGGFSVESSLASSSADGQSSGEGMTDQDVTEHDKNDILSGIEDPKPAVSRTEENNYEPLVDHLLGTSNRQAEQKVVHKAPEPPANLPAIEESDATAAPIIQKPASEQHPIQAPPKPKGPDPYREPTK